MKNLLFFIVFLISVVTYSQNVNIPDANFKSILLAQYDANSDGEIQTSEIPVKSLMF